MPKIELLLEKIYKETLLIPYNSASTFYFKNKKTTPRELGGHCHLLSRCLKKQLFLLGFKKTWYLRSGRAHSVLLKTKDGLFFFDPYIQHKKPIKLVPRKNQKIKAYPTVKTGNGLVKESYIKLKWLDKNVFCLKKYRWSEPKNKYLASSFVFDISQKCSQGAKTTKNFIYHPEQTTLSLRFLDPKTEKVFHLVYPLSKRRISKRNIYLKTNSGIKINSLDKEFKEFFQTHCLPVPMDFIMKYLINGAKLYWQNAPKNLAFSESNPANM